MRYFSRDYDDIAKKTGTSVENTQGKSPQRGGRSPGKAASPA
jgi:hypothetical protein